MNISSVVVNLKSVEFKEFVLEQISKMPTCEIVANQDDKIVVLIMDENLDGQLESFKFLERINGVNDVIMVYNYEDLDEEIDLANEKKPVKDFLNDDNVDAKDICYSGSVHYKAR